MVLVDLFESSTSHQYQIAGQLATAWLRGTERSAVDIEKAGENIFLGRACESQFVMEGGEVKCGVLCFFLVFFLAYLPHLSVAKAGFLAFSSSVRVLSRSARGVDIGGCWIGINFRAASSLRGCADGGKKCEEQLETVLGTIYLRRRGVFVD